ncbi:MULTISPECIES: hypothetical protein [Pectobacterium]|uniref:hypothetical protein n=1 Tax=Pectobacterium TaxID=122277 RepID=UPI0004E77AFA|nr:hypothetical protein [Pectobacterium brasiliense]KFF61864.1 hypothetical protein IV99_21635 [Pectobacterium brasiliense]KHT14265.1 hypothetical protein RC95_17785 [Pectobacterium brasiliense]MDY4380805.1 hypothetical protein [Pectobacterium brasiliense]UDQ74349.1 hypothetical protein LJQ72_12195 [Pectobacterium brasiliense]WJM79654.1 hypothetical protein QTI90_15240 [Pectobacterium brasiliense]
MEIRDWITITSALIIAVGWFVTGYLNRIKDVAQKRLEYRLKALESFLPVYFSIEKNGAPFTQPDFLTQLENSRSNFQLYGLKDEIELMQYFISAIEEKNLPEANIALNKLVPLVRSRIRKELSISS